MLRWARAWRVPHGILGASSPRRSAVPVTFSSSRSSGQGNADPRPLPLSYNLLDGDATLPAIVFLHGLFGSKTNFNSLAKAMVQRTGRRVLTVDARNHGDSPHSPDASYEAMSRDLQGLFPQLGLAPCVVVGHSMGGKTAMLLALQRPDLVERLVVVDISPVGTTPGSHLGNFIAAMKAVEIPEKVPHSQARKLADRQLTSAVKVTLTPRPPSPFPMVGGPHREPLHSRQISPQEAGVRQFLLTNLVEVGGRFSWRVNLDTLAQHLDKILTFPRHLESYSGPTLFLLGGNSPYVQPSHHSEIRRLFPQAQFQTVPDAGHWVHSDKPQDFMDAVTGFLA